MVKTKKVLLVTTVSGFIPQFEMNNVRLLQSMGYEVHYASNFKTPSYGKDNHRLDGTGIIRHQIDFVRSPFKLSNIAVYRQLRSLMEAEDFSLVHCHTPMGGVIARLAAHSTHTKPVIYTAHGFHFFKGASLINWLCFYPMEWFLSRYTDQQICINKEDYLIAKKTFRAKYVDYVPGVGIDLKKIPSMTPEQIKAKKTELGLPENKILLLSSGELIKRKNHETIIKTMALLKEKGDSAKTLSNLHYIICGHGALENYLKEMVVSLNLTDMVTFLGYREDMLELYQVADIFMFPSFQEGLPMALLEAMACGLPVICSEIRGSLDLMEPSLSHTDTLSYCSGGIMVKKVDDAQAYTEAVVQMLSCPEKLSQFSQANKEKSHAFSTTEVINAMGQIYRKVLSINR